MIFYLILSLVSYSFAFTWKVNEKLLSNRILTYSEQYMFASHKGPVLFPQGSSTITSDIAVSAILTENITAPFVAYAVYDTSIQYSEYSLLGMCGFDKIINIEDNSWASKVKVERVVLQYKNAVTSKQVIGHDTITTTSYHFTSKLLVDYEVLSKGWYNVAMELCIDDNSRRRTSEMSRTSSSLTRLPLSPSYSHSRPRSLVDSGDSSAPSGEYYQDTDDSESPQAFDSMNVVGTISFRNPYGYIPSSLFGLLPYQFTLVVGYGIIIAYYSYHMYCHRPSIIGLHYGVLCVLIIASLESLLWLISYVYINQVGIPFCCPYPVIIEASYIAQILRQTVSRTLLLIISLGYGMVKEKLPRIQWIGIAFITVMYYISATFSEVFDMNIRNHLPMSHYDTNNNVLLDEQYIYFAEIVIDSVFIVWIYGSFNATIQILQEYSQTYKLALYNKLYTTIGVFILLFILATVLLFYSNNIEFNFPWQLQWLPIVLFPTLNYCILVAIALISLPDDSSRYLSYATQLPNYDIDGSTNSDSVNHIEMIDPHLDMMLDDDDIMNQEHGSMEYKMTPPVSKLLYKNTKTPTPMKAPKGSNPVIASPMHTAPASVPSNHTPLSKYQVRINPNSTHGSNNTPVRKLSLDASV